MATGETPDRANVVALPPLLFVSTFAVGLLLRFLLPTPLLLCETALWISALLLIGVSVLLAFRHMIVNKTTRYKSQVRRWL